MFNKFQDRVYKAIFLIGFNAVVAPGAALNLIFLLVCIYGMCKKKISRKLYIFLINKTVGDMVAAISHLGKHNFILFFTFKILTIAAHYVATTTPNSLILSTFVSVGQITGNWTSSLTFIALSFLALLAQKRPFLHRRIRTTRFCVLISLVCWPIAFILGLSGMRYRSVTFENA